MKNIKISVLIITLAALLAILFLCFLYRKDEMVDHAGKNTDNICSELKASLLEKEKIIGAELDGSTAFIITSKIGRTDYGDTFAVFNKQENGDWKRCYENDFKELRPWRIETADIDGDQVKEIITAVHKTTHFDKTIKNRLFVFNFTDGKLIKKWTGSQIAGDWEDFAVGDFAPTKGSEVLFIRHTVTGERVSIYYWYRFGFLLLTESDDYEDITQITEISTNHIKIEYKKAKKQHTAILDAREERLIEVAD